MARSKEAQGGRRKKVLGRGPQLPYREMIYVVSEGGTEEDYLRQDIFSDVVLPGGRRRTPKVIPRTHGGRTNPRSLLKDMKEYLKKHPLRKNDEAWIVVDYDGRPLEDFAGLFVWDEADPRHRVAISNPCFETFLVAHYERPAALYSQGKATERLRFWMPEYDKRLSKGAFTVDQARNAIGFMKSAPWREHGTLPGCGLSDVWMLVEELLEGKAGATN